MKLALFAAMVLAIVARATLFAEGGNVGAWATWLVFWISLPAFVYVSFRRSGDDWRSGRRSPMLRSVLELLFVICFFLTGTSDNEAFETVVISLGFAAVVALVVVSIRSWWTGRKTRIA